MNKPKLVRITTVPLSLEKLLNGQWSFFREYYSITAVSSEENQLKKFEQKFKTNTFYLPLTRKITPFQDLYCIFRLYCFLRKEKPLIVHSQTPKAGLIGMIAAFLARVPIRMHDVVGLPLMEKTGAKYYLLYWVDKLVYACAHQVYPNSYGLKEYMIKTKMAKHQKMTVLGNGSSNGIDVEYFSKKHFSVASKTAFLEKWQLLSNDFVFLFIGRLVGDKGINELVNAFDALSKKEKNIKLLLVGPYENQLDPLLQQTKDKIKANSKIIATGFQEDVRPFLAHTSCFVFPSYREGFPNVVLEAAAMEIPSIVSDINGSNEIIFDQINGLVIPKKNKLKLKKAMNYMLSDKEFRVKMSINARKGIAEKFEKKVFYGALLNEYKKRENLV